jgi:uncharacterized membrane protein YvbJ
MQELQCFKCGSINNFGNKFCTNCGEKFQYSCPKCNSIVNPGIRFCSNCAAELAWYTAPQSAQVETIAEKQDEIKPTENLLDIPSNERAAGPRRNIVPFIIILVLILVVIVVIFIADIFL